MQAFSSLCGQRRARQKENWEIQDHNAQGMTSKLPWHCWSVRSHNNTWQVFHPCQCEWWLWSCVHWWIYVYITTLLLLFLSTPLGGILDIISDNASLKACQIETVHAPAPSCPLLRQFWAAVSVPTLSHIAESIKLHVKKCLPMSKEKIRWQALNKPPCHCLRLQCLARKLWTMQNRFLGYFCKGYAACIWYRDGNLKE